MEKITEIKDGIIKTIDENGKEGILVYNHHPQMDLKAKDIVILNPWDIKENNDDSNEEAKL